MIPFDVYMMYKAIKVHFQSDVYNYHDYNGKLSTVKPKAFDNGKEKFVFLKLLNTYRKNDLEDFLVANIYNDPKLWANQLLEDEANTKFLEFKKRKQSITYIFCNDLETILSKGDFKTVFKINDGEDPIVLKLYYRKEITAETFCILNCFFKFFDSFDEKLNDNLIWPTHKFKLKKLTPFIKFDRNKLKQELLKRLK